MQAGLGLGLENNVVEKVFSFPLVPDYGIFFTNSPVTEVAGGRWQWCDWKGHCASLWGYLKKYDLGFPIQAKSLPPWHSAVQTNLYSATCGCKLYFLFLTNMNTVFALKIHCFSCKIFPLAVCLWDVEFCLADGQRGRVARLHEIEWIPWTWGILFFSELLCKF